MEVYGLTGGIGSGKSTVADLLEEYGVPVVAADELSRIVVARGSRGLQDVVELFGPGVVDENGDLDRQKMAAIVFQDPGKRRELESILHPRIRERFEQVLDALEKAGHQVAVYEVPLLFEKNLQGEMKAVILVTADDAVRVERVRARDDVTQTEVRARMAAQMDEATKRRKADYVIENNGTRDDLRREVEFLLARFLRVGGRDRSAGTASGAEDQPVPPIEESRLDTVVPTSAPGTEPASGGTPTPPPPPDPPPTPRAPPPRSNMTTQPATIVPSTAPRAGGPARARQHTEPVSTVGPPPPTSRPRPPSDEPPVPDPTPDPDAEKE